MDNQKHTPGPWKVEHTFGEMIIRDSEDYPIAVIHGEDAIEESKYNAELIARAPEQAKRIEELEAERSEVRKVIHERYNHLKWLKEVNTTPPSVIDEIMFLESILNSIKKEL